MKAIIFEGDKAKCPECEEEVKKNESGNYPGQCGNCHTELVIGGSQQTEIGGSQQTLSQKYTVLGLYKVLAYLLMIVNTAFTIYSFVQISEASNAMKKFGGGSAMDNANLTLVITYFISMFSLFCLTKMIDFLFDLDKHKSDK